MAKDKKQQPTKELNPLERLALQQRQMDVETILTRGRTPFEIDEVSETTDDKDEPRRHALAKEIGGGVVTLDVASRAQRRKRQIPPEQPRDGGILAVKRALMSEPDATEWAPGTSEEEKRRQVLAATELLKALPELDESRDTDLEKYTATLGELGLVSGTSGSEVPNDAARVNSSD